MLYLAPNTAPIRFRRYDYSLQRWPWCFQRGETQLSVHERGCISILTRVGEPGFGVDSLRNFTVARTTMLMWRAILAIVCFVCVPVGWSQEKPARFEIGPLFTYLRVPDSIPINAQNQAEIGGRFSWNFARHFALDAEIEASPFRTTNLQTGYQGGYLSQAFVGLKSGKRWNRFGIFGNFRPGLDSYSGVIKGITATTIFPITYGRRTDPSFNFGGVLEFYLSRRVLFRYDFGDTIIHYNTGSLFTTGGQSLASPSEVKNNFQFSTAVAFRF